MHTFSLVIDVYIWIILFRILAFIFIYSPYNPITRLWFNVTDPAMQLLNGIIPPLQVNGIYLHNISVMLVLLLI
ncbi:MAG: YggT family protein, partial [Desulfobaccales bacterium]